jgi:hypothetical protein
MSTQSGSGYGQQYPGPGGPAGPPGYGTPPGPPGGQPPTAFEEEPEKKPNMAVFWTVAVVLAIVLGVGGYLFGQSQGKKDYDAGTAGYKKIYNAGFDAGAASGAATGAAKGKKAGEAAGQAAGQKAGLEQGTKQGVAQGTQQGAAAALGGFSSWQTGSSFYVIQMSPGTQDAVPYVISSRVLMDPDYEYTLCASDPSNLCSFAKGTSGNDGGGASAGDGGGPGAGAGDNNQSGGPGANAGND